MNWVTRVLDCSYGIMFSPLLPLIFIWSGWVIPWVSKLLEVGLREPVLTPTRTYGFRTVSQGKRINLPPDPRNYDPLQLCLRILKYFIGNSSKEVWLILFKILRRAQRRCIHMHIYTYIQLSESCPLCLDIWIFFL